MNDPLAPTPRPGTQPPRTTYRVRVGHWEQRVQADDVDTAIRLARRRLAQDLPRLYDVIRNLTPARFQVEPAA